MSDVTTATVARAGRVVGNASFGLAVLYAESVTASGFDGTYRCFGGINHSDVPDTYTILQYKLTVGEFVRVTLPQRNKVFALINVSA